MSGHAGVTQETPVRPLSRSERVLLAIDRVMPLNFTTIARVVGAVSPSGLDAALAALQRRHALLRVGIQAIGGAPTFVASPVPCVPRFVERGDLVTEVEREASAAFDPRVAPLFRVVWVKHPGGGHLLVTLHHTIGDGKSGVFATRDLLRALGGADLEPLPLALPVDARLAAAGRGARGVASVSNFMAGELWADLRDGKPVTLPHETTSAPGDRRVLFFPVERAASDVSRYVERCRAEQTTLHGVMLAAEALAVVAELGDAPRSVMLGSPVDLRPTLEPPVGEDVGLFVSMLGYRGRISPASNIWDLARAARGRIERGRRVKFEHATLGALGLVSAALGADCVAPEVFAGRWESMIRATAGLTNLGRLPCETRFGELELEALHFVPNPSILAFNICSATSLAGNLTWNFAFVSPNIGRARAGAVVRETVTRFDAAFD